MSLRRAVLRLVRVAAPLLVALSCASPGDEGSETNFVSCERHADCDALGPEYACIGGRCRVADRSSGVESAGGGTSSGSCVPSSCPVAEFGTPCCVAADGPCGIDTGFGCDPWKGGEDAGGADAQ